MEEGEEKYLRLLINFSGVHNTLFSIISAFLTGQFLGINFLPYPYPFFSRSIYYNDLYYNQLTSGLHSEFIEIMNEKDPELVKIRCSQEKKLGEAFAKHRTRNSDSRDQIKFQVNFDLSGFQ